MLALGLTPTLNFVERRFYTKFAGSTFQEVGWIEPSKGARNFVEWHPV
jgi:hypothetical protein